MSIGTSLKTEIPQSKIIAILEERHRYVRVLRCLAYTIRRNLLRGGSFSADL